PERSTETPDLHRRHRAPARCPGSPRTRNRIAVGQAGRGRLAGMSVLLPSATGGWSVPRRGQARFRERDWRAFMRHRTSALPLAITQLAATGAGARCETRELATTCTDRR